MGWMRKYLAGFRMALSRELIYRTNFIFGRVRELIIFGSLMFLYSALPDGAGPYDQERLLTYAIAGVFVAAVLFVFGMENIANEIAEGDLVNFLLRPVRYLWFWTFRISATRALLVVAGIAEIFILRMIFPSAELFFQSQWEPWIASLVLLLGAIILVQLLDFIAGSFSFWTHRGHGPRWFIQLTLLVLSGAYFPIDLYPVWLKDIIMFTPFPSVAYVPIRVYLGDLAGPIILQSLFVQWFWISLFGLILYVLWSRGVKSYEAFGR